MDADNTEDVNDLESRLYSQVHHDTATEGSTALSESNANDLGAVPNDDTNPSRPRYWNKGQQVSRPKKRINPFAGIQQSKKEESVDNSSVFSSDLKPFRPYVPYFSNNEVIPDASGGDQVSKGSASHSISDENSKRGNIPPDKSTGGNSDNDFPNIRKMNKLSKAISYQLKKLRANQVREKQKEKRSVIETIVVESSDDDDDDVVEIPLPKPPTVTIESSDESDTERKDSVTFVKPQELLKTEDKANSRCVSPSSVMSDDFIGQTDRSRIAQQKNIANDEDLVYVQETVDSCVYQDKRNKTSGPSKEGNSSIEKPNFVTPRRKDTRKSTDYNVTQSNFRAIDVYESESSDMPDYDKEKEASVRASSSSTAEVDKDRSKRLKKRRKSGSAKESEPNESSDSEGEHAVAKTGLPFIFRGVAVESCKDNMKRSRVAATEDPSDKEFISMLATISQPNKLPDPMSESDKSAGSVEDITARELVEDVLNKKDKSANKPKDEEVEVVQEKSDAIPLDTSADIDKILDSIDKMQSVIESSESEDGQEDILEYTGEEEILSITDVLKYQKPHEIAPEENGLHSVYTNGQHIGWSEEMIRFYNWCWGQRKFNVWQIKRGMIPSAKWTIYTEDRFPKVRRFSNLKCHNCCEYGHTRARCPKPKKDLICYMCGEVGHLEPRCPSTICLRCGNKTNVFTRSCNICTHQNQLICPICKIRGHSTQLCPDKWRRYHSTTQPNEYPEKKVEYNERKFCCICAREGHLSENCKSALRFSEYPTSVSEIKSYAKAYDDDLIKFPMGRNVTGYSLLSRPCDGVLFNFTHDITPEKYYGRFLNAVGLKHLMTWTKKGKSSKRKSKSLPGEEPKKKLQKKSYVLNPFANTNKENTDEEPGTSTDKTAQEEHPGQDIVLNVENEKQENILKTPKASMPAQHLKDSPSQSTSDLQSEKNNETTSSYAAFSKNINSNQSTPKGSKNKCRKLGPLPDFIPLNNSDDDDDVDEEESKGNVENPSEVDLKDDLAQENEICEAKVYLSNFHSRYLLSPDNKYLAESSKKFSVKTKVEWSSVGNVLIIEGFASAQDKFHEDLMETFRTLSDQTNRKELEKSQKVPRRREALIRFLQENILQLDKYLGNVTDLYKKLQNAQKQQTKNSWKTAEKMRRLLNMILMGQAGLRKGKENFEALMNNLRALREDNSTEIVSDKMRDEIGEQWKYIFTSQQHENFDDLIEQYLTLKKNNELPKLILDYNLLGGKFLDVSLTDEQKQQLNNKLEKEEQKPEQKNFVKSEEKLTPASQELKQEEGEATDPVATPIQAAQNFAKQQFRRPNAIPRRNFKPRSFGFGSDQINQHEYGGWRNRSRNAPNQFDRSPQHPRRNFTNNFASPSVYWSNKCINYINDCLDMHPGHSSVQNSLYKLQEKAKRGMLSQNDYKSLLNVRNVLTGTSG